MQAGDSAFGWSSIPALMSSGWTADGRVANTLNKLKVDPCAHLAIWATDRVRISVDN